MKRIFVAGHNGMVGSALVRALNKTSTCEVIVRDRASLDLLDQQAVRAFFHEEKVDEVYLAAAKVGGILANNDYPAEFIYENLVIEANVIHSAHEAGVDRLMFLGSSCIYPKFADQPIKEDSLLTGKLEATNEPYAVAKIAGIKLCESYNRQYGHDYRAVMPTNLYGPGDNFDLQTSHVIPGLMHRIHLAKIQGNSAVTIWGTGTPRREFLYVDDMATAAIHVMNIELSRLQQITTPMSIHINIGVGKECSILELARKIADIVGYKGEIKCDTEKPDGTPRKLLNVDRLDGLGWRPSYTLESGLESTYRWFLKHFVN